MTPRIAIQEDVPFLVEMGARFHAMSPHKMIGEFDAAAVNRMLSAMVAAPDHAALITNGQGMIGGMTAPVYFAPEVTMFEEAFWWADRGGKELLSASEAVARSMNARLYYLSVLVNEHHKAADRMVKRMGYVPVETKYVKDLTK